jgi:carboxylesterase
MLAVRERRRRTVTKEVTDRLPPGPDGVIPGAHGIRLGDGGRGVLLLHGFGDTPQSLRVLAESLHSGGWSVRAPLLPGHGRSLRAFARSRAADWLSAARSALDELRDECHSVSIVGQSMGGSLAVILAADTPVDALVLLAPYFELTPAAERVARISGIASLVLPWVRSGAADSLIDPGARRAALGFRVTTPGLLRELRTVTRRGREAMRSLDVPTLVMHSEQDPRIPREAAESAWAALPCRTRELYWLARSGHVIAADQEREVVTREVTTWLERHGGHDRTGGTRDRPAGRA